MFDHPIRHPSPSLLFLSFPFPRAAAVDGVLLASTLVLLGDTLIRSLATALSYAVASGGLYVGLFFAATMALDISFLAGNWAVRAAAAAAVLLKFQIFCLYSLFLPKPSTVFLPSRLILLSKTWHDPSTPFLLNISQARQTGWRFLTAIRAARVSRVLRLYSVWQLWRSTTVRKGATAARQQRDG